MPVALTLMSPAGWLQKTNRQLNTIALPRMIARRVQQKLLPATADFHSGTSHTILIIQENFENLPVMRFASHQNNLGIDVAARTPPLGELACAHT